MATAPAGGREGSDTAPKDGQGVARNKFTVIQGDEYVYGNPVHRHFSDSRYTLGGVRNFYFPASCNPAGAADPHFLPDDMARLESGRTQDIDHAPEGIFI